MHRNGLTGFYSYLVFFQRRKYNNLLAELRGQARGDVYDRLVQLILSYAHAF